MRSLVVLVTVLTASFAFAAAAPARSQDLAFERRAALERQVLQELNQARAARGLQPLRAQPGLRTAAVSHSRTMLSAGFFAHESPDGTPFHNRIRRHYPARGWETWSVGETLLSGAVTLDARAVVAAWLTSAPHRQIVLSRNWREAGIGVFYRSDAPGSFGGTETLAVTADFGHRSRKLLG